MGRPSALLIVNPVASGLVPGQAERVAAALADGLAVETVRTEGQGHAESLARDAARAGRDLVAVLSGDGTLSEAAAGLVGTATALVPLPAGVTSVVARTLGAPADPVAAARSVAARRPAEQAVDVGTVNGRPFLFSSGVGLSAAVMARAEATPSRKASLGQLHYVAVATGVARRYVRDPPVLRVLAGDGRRFEGITVIAQNAEALTYFGPQAVRVSRGAGLATGSLSLTGLRSARARDVPGVLARLISGRAAAVVAHPLVEALPAVRDATVTGADGARLPVEADGEYLGEHARVVYGCAPGALRMLAWRPLIRSG